MGVVQVNNGRYRVPWHPGLTVQDVIRRLRFSYALLVVRLNDRVVPRDEWATCQVHPQDDLKIWHMIAE